MEQKYQDVDTLKRNTTPSNGTEITRPRLIVGERAVEQEGSLVAEQDLVEQEGQSSTKRGIFTILPLVGHAPCSRQLSPDQTFRHDYLVRQPCHASPAVQRSMMDHLALRAPCRKSHCKCLCNANAVTQPSRLAVCCSRSWPDGICPHLSCQDGIMRRRSSYAKSSYLEDAARPSAIYIIHLKHLQLRGQPSGASRRG